MSKVNKVYKSGVEGSAYWSWVNEHAGNMADSHLVREDAEANPDSLSEGDAFVYKNELTDEQEEQISAYYKVISGGVLRKLAPRQREIWKLRFFRWCSEEEIAEKLGISLSAVRTHLTRAADKIKVEIEKQKKKKQMMNGNYFNDGFKKKIHTKGETKTDKEFGERLEKAQEEIDEFCKKHPELGRE